MTTSPQRPTSTLPRERRQQQVRIDEQHAIPTPSAQFRQAAKQPRPTWSFLGMLSKAFLWLGPLILVKGLTLLVWTSISRGEPLWIVCTPLISGGQLTIVLGLLIKLGLMSRNGVGKQEPQENHQTIIYLSDGQPQTTVEPSKPHVRFDSVASREATRSEAAT